MKWMTLFNKIGKQKAVIIQKADVYAIINDKNILLELKFKADGSPYLVPKTEK